MREALASLAAERQRFSDELARAEAEVQAARARQETAASERSAAEEDLWQAEAAEQKRAERPAAEEARQRLVGA